MEPLENTTIHEGGAPPEPAAPETFTSFDGSTVEIPKPPPKVKPQRRAGGIESTTEPETPGAIAEPEVGKKTGREAMRRDGESDAEFLERDSREQRARARRAEQERQELEGHLRRMAEEQQQLRSMMEPFLREQYRQAHEQQQRQQMAAIPDREADPEGWRDFMLEQNLRLTLEQQQRLEQQQQHAALLQQQQAAALEQAQRVYEFDSAWSGELDEALTDPEVETAYQAYLAAQVEQARFQFPEANDEDIFTLVRNDNVLEARSWHSSGISMADGIRAKVRVLQAAMARLRPTAPAQNGRQQVASPTAQRVASEAARVRQQQAVSSAGSPGRAGGIPGQSLDPSLFESEDDYVRAAQEGMFDSEKFLKERFGRQKKISSGL